MVTLTQNISSLFIVNHVCHQSQVYQSRQVCQLQVARTSLGQLLASDQYKQIVIPVFQRPYCWPETQLETWVENVAEGCESLANLDVEEMFEVVETDEFHSVGIGRFKKVKVKFTYLIIKLCLQFLISLGKLDMC